MRVLILHSDVAPGAPADDQDTLAQIPLIAEALKAKGHAVAHAPFKPDRAALSALIARERPDIVFNLVEAVWGRGSYAPIAVSLLNELGVLHTGVGSFPMAIGDDKLVAKRLLKAVALPTPRWAEPPDWKAVRSGRWIVKSVDEDCSLGLDDGAVVEAAGVRARAEFCAARYGGRWFAEEFIEGREFHVAVIEKDGKAHALPAAEMVFERWDDARPCIMGANAKWNEDSEEFDRTNWKFDGIEEPALHALLAGLAVKAFRLFGLNGYARVDFRVDGDGKPHILEINPNPSLSLNCALAASAAHAKISYADLIETILLAARPISDFPG